MLGNSTTKINLGTRCKPNSLSVSEGYCLPDEDEAALAEVQRLDVVAAGPSAALPTTFEAEILPPAPSPEAEMDLTDGGDGTEGTTPSQGGA